MLVAARTSPEENATGISLLAVDTKLEGFSVGRVLDKVGQDESDTAELAFENVRVSNDDLVGPLDTGFISMMQFLPQERLGTAITGVAHAKQILEETIQYAKDRVAFGQPIGKFQNTQFLLADLQTRIDVTEAFVDQCVMKHNEKRLTAIDPGAVGGPRPLPADPRRLRLHERVPRGPCLARRPRDEDLGRLQRDHEDADRPGPGSLSTE